VKGESADEVLTSALTGDWWGSRPRGGFGSGSQRLDSWHPGDHASGGDRWLRHVEERRERSQLPAAAVNNQQNNGVLKKVETGR